jgi:hypothetical protein
MPFRKTSGTQERRQKQKEKRRRLFLPLVICFERIVAFRVREKLLSYFGVVSITLTVLPSTLPPSRLLIAFWADYK